MRWHGSPGSGAWGGGRAGPGFVIEVPADAGAAPARRVDPATLSQAERARRAIAESRRARPLRIDRAFLAAALDQRRVMRTLVAAAVPRFADWCFVDLVDGNGIPRRVEVAHGDPAKALVARQMRSIRFGPGWATPGCLAIRDRAPRLYRELSEELLAWMAHDERHLAVLRAIRPNSMICVPLVADDRAIGAITLVRSTTFPAFDEDDLVFAEELATPAALALAGACAYQAERAGRASAEALADRERAGRLEAERSALRLRRLESLATALSPALAPEAIARLVVENGLSALEPSSAALVRASAAGDRLDVLHAEGWPADLARGLHALPADARALAAEAYRVEAAIWLPSVEALLAAQPTAELSRRIGGHAWAAVPLRADGRTLGAIELGFPRPRELDPEERRFLLAVAQLAAQALERARLRAG
jgi:GAF domain-containing protein